MKKLMIAVAALTAGIAMADVVSSEVVGYAQAALQSGAKIVTPQFLGLTTQDGQIELQSIKCAEEDSDLVVINTLDPLGLTLKSYVWVTYGGATSDEWCWLDGDTMEKPEQPVYFAAGQALWVEGDSEDNIFQTSGKVSTADLDVTLQSGATMTGNFTPVQIELQDITCREDDSDLVVINTLDPLGLTLKSYVWVTYGGASGDEWCWLDGDTMEKPEEPVYFAAGEGLWVEGDSEENVITFPGVEL